MFHHRLHICVSMFCLGDLFSGDISKMKLYQTIHRRIHICVHPDHLFQDEIAWYVEGVASWMQKHDCNVHSDVLFLFHGQILPIKIKNKIFFVKLISRKNIKGLKADRNKQKV